MDLEFTTDQDELRANVAGVLAAECPRSLPRAIAEGTGTADELWRHMVDLGWPALTVPEPAGGLGFGAVELAIVCEELGRALAPTPLFTTVAQFVPVLCAFDDTDRLAAVATDGRTGTLAIAEPGADGDLADVTATATPDGDSWVLAGTKSAVLDGDRADDVLVVARTPDTSGDDGIGVFVVDRAAVTVTPVPDVDLTRPIATLTLDGVTLASARVLGAPGVETATTLRRCLEESTVAIAAELVGVTSALFEDTLAYAKEREQFGVPIGSFQAIKHKLTDMYVLLERARATVYFAALTIDEGDDRRSLAASMAKAAAGDAAQRIAREAIQTHGGIGYTWEHDTHLFVRRALADSALGGSASVHRDRVADAIGLG